MLNRVGGGFMDLKKSVFITGATQNTGLEVAKSFAGKGYDLHITSRSLESAEKIAYALKQEYPEVQVYPYALDLKDVKDICRVFSKVKETSGTLDVFVANAADLAVDIDVYNVTEERYDEIMDTNVKGNFFCCRESAKLMKDNGGSIILISSVQSKGAVEGRTVYSMSKAALNMVGKTLAFDLAPYNIRVNTVIAGAVHTHRWDALDEDFANARRKAYPLKREVDLSDIVNGVLYFAGDEAKMVTGAELVIDAGVMVPLLTYKDRKCFEREFE